ncbi:tam Trans-aconitate 2-methyltransferase [uncultured Caudovirales phage]|uniref:Tam Trans-aconitate 2-methyltransferase n=1 Tax=uncultured Caudovirales phage TaxID=2100421 RepID=A0A6J5NZB4_9CAUD|nr:tam Trans-aconitate 2-methyltransferase [uncultured Caudovirales phage]CAB4156770.1 tam Trans-aconitate 2-methyltransferase [uncultured Caudovirales phage]CAB4160044.1 tam Trans-aconitate 2-methyltransferase [uncultured Caudovirales phage]CAB4164909.1 tam Trans-aconitate 2-methyltransferase [uncultured Caudovirales phage]CAB4172253.1 tam Trans-aconitate 2-methyltransferase [uncultured Caudovirales phage]
MSENKNPKDLGLDLAYGYENSTDLQRFYDDVAQGYEDYIRQTGYSLHKHLFEYITLNAELDGYMVLDVGCGTGVIGELISDDYPHCVVDGVDISIEMIKISGSKIVDPSRMSPNAGKQIYRSIIKADLKTDFNIMPSNRYDLIVSAGVFTTGHLGFSDLVNLIPSLKHKGQVIITVKKNVFNDDEFKFKLNELVDSKSISDYSIKEVDIYENTIYNDQSYILHFRKI